MIVKQILERLLVDEVRDLVCVGRESVVVIEAHDVELIQPANMHPPIGQPRMRRRRLGLNLCMPSDSPDLTVREDVLRIGQRQLLHVSFVRLDRRLPA